MNKRNWTNVAIDERIATLDNIKKIKKWLDRLELAVATTEIPKTGIKKVENHQFKWSISIDSNWERTRLSIRVDIRDRFLKEKLINEDWHNNNYGDFIYFDKLFTEDIKSLYPKICVDY